jgi:hypothetical protein
LRFPAELWPDPVDSQRILALADAFADHPLLLTDKLANTVYMTNPVETLFGDRNEALINRLALSLLGFGERDRVAPGLVEALTGEAGPWRGIVQAQTAAGPLPIFAEVSAAKRPDGRLLCGIIRLGKPQGGNR